MTDATRPATAPSPPEMRPRPNDVTSTRRGPQVEVAHEALIAHWPKLRAWLAEDPGLQRLRQAVGEAAAEWDAHGRLDGYLVHDESPRFEQAFALTQQTRFPLSARERAYLDACGELRAQRRRRRQILVRAVFGLAAVALVVAALAGLAYRDARENERRANEQTGVAQANERRANEQEGTAEAEAARAKEEEANAQHQAQVARSRQLAAQASERVDDQLDLALLLSLEALRLDDSPEARGSLLTSLLGSPETVRIVQLGAEMVTASAVSPDGRTVAVASMDGTIALWDSESGTRTVSSLYEAPGAVNVVTFNPSGSILAAGTTDGSVLLWDIASDESPRPVPTGHTGSVSVIAFSHDGATLASAGSDTTVRLWDVATRSSHGDPLIGHDSWVRGLAFAPNDNQRLASGDIGGTVIVWNTDSYAQTPLYGVVTIVSCLAFGPDGSVLAVGDTEGEVELLNVADGSSTDLGPSHASTVTAVAFSRDGERLASAGADGTIHVWSLGANVSFEAQLTGHIGGVAGLGWGEEANLLSVSSAGTLYARNFETGPRLGHVIETGNDEVLGVTFLDGVTVAWAADLATIGLWNVTSDSQSGPRMPHILVSWIFFDPTGHRLVSVSHFGEVRSWNPVTNSEIAELVESASDDALFAAALSPDGQIIALGGADGTISLWNAITGDQIPLPALGHETYLTGLTFAQTANGLVLASGAFDGSVVVWNVETGQALARPVAGGPPITSLTMNADGSMLVWGDEEGGVTFWNASDGTLAQTHRQIGHYGSVSALAFSPDGNLVASGGADGSLVLWEVVQPSGIRQIGPSIPAHSLSVMSLAFSPDGKSLASGGGSVVIVWDVDRASWQQRACALAGRDLSREEWSQFLPDQPFPSQPVCASLPIDDAAASPTSIVAVTGTPPMAASTRTRCRMRRARHLDARCSHGG